MYQKVVAEGGGESCKLRDCIREILHSQTIWTQRLIKVSVYAIVVKVNCGAFRGMGF